MNVIEKVFAEPPETFPDNLFGKVTNPLPKYGGIEGAGGQAGGLILLFSNILRLVFVLAGIYAFLNLIIAGYQYISAAGDAKTLTAAWARIWQSLLGLVIIVGSFALAALFGYIIFGDATYILNPHIYGPGK